MKKFTKTFTTALVALTSLAMIGCSSFGSKPEGDQMKALESSPQFKGDKFGNVPPTVDTMEMGMFALLWEFLFKSRKPSEPLPSVKPVFASTLTADQLNVYWLGHSTLIIETGGKRFITDPIFGSASPFSFLMTRLQPAPIAFEELPEIHGVLISHDHYDHLEMPTVKKFAAKGVPFFVPLGVGSHLRGWGVSEDLINEMDWWDEKVLDGVTIACTPSRHFSGRGLSDGNSTLWSSWSIIGDKKRFFYSGDTAYSPHFKAIGEKYGPFDIAAMENGAYNENWSDVHLFPEQSVQASLEVQAKAMIPVHWGMYDLALHDWFEPIKRAVQHGDKIGANVLTPQIGQTIRLEEKSVLSRWWGML
ncbi:MAG: MBL fold metallo-hydrolase [Pseudobacteriovorax sp.]|nr:MBL fold metallo-hydrolase [Pseudobacteriovorax sp.]